MTMMPLAGISGVYRRSPTGVRLVRQPITLQGLVLGGGPPLQWSDVGWYQLGQTEPYWNSYVQAMVMYKGKLIVGGLFPSLNGITCNHVAAWDGKTWQPLGEGLTYPSNPNYARCEALYVFEGELYVGGLFTHAGGIPVIGGIAKWNGSSWSRISNASYTDTGGSVTAMCQFRGDLILGIPIRHTNPDAVGGLNLVARWDGSDMHPLGKGLLNAYASNGIATMVEYQGDLIIGGRFYRAVQSNNNRINVQSMVRWNGSTWSEFGSLSHPSAGDGIGGCNSLCMYRNQLYAAGWYNAIGNLDAWALARHTGSHWESVGGDPFTAYQYATSLCVHEDKLAVNGELYIELGNDEWFINTGLWSPEQGWQPLGTGGPPSGCMLSMERNKPNSNNSDGILTLSSPIFRP